MFFFRNLKIVMRKWDALNLMTPALTILIAKELPCIFTTQLQWSFIFTFPPIKNGWDLDRKVEREKKWYCNYFTSIPLI